MKLEIKAQIIILHYMNYILNTNLYYGGLGTRINIDTIDKKHHEIWLKDEDSLIRLEKILINVKELRKNKFKRLLGDD